MRIPSLLLLDCGRQAELIFLVFSGMVTLRLSMVFFICVLLRTLLPFRQNAAGRLELGDSLLSGSESVFCSQLRLSLSFEKLLTGIQKIRKPAKFPRRR